MKTMARFAGIRRCLAVTMIVVIGVVFAATAFAGNVEWVPWTEGRQRPWLSGERYEALVPDTLDLTRYAELGLNGQMGQVDVEEPASGEIWIANVLNTNPPYMIHMYGVAGMMQTKTTEPVAAMRIMTGSALNLDVEK